MEAFRPSSTGLKPSPARNIEFSLRQNTTSRGYQRKAKSIYAYSRLSQSKVMPFDRLRASGFQDIRAELVEAHYCRNLSRFKLIPLLDLDKIEIASQHVKTRS